LKKQTLIVCLCTLFLALPLAAQDESGPVGFLTQEKSGAPALDVAMEYIRSVRAEKSLTDGDVAALEVARQFVSKSSGTTHIYLRQSLGGLEVVNSDTNVNVARDGRVINLGDRMVRNLATAAAGQHAVLSAEDAIHAGARLLGLELAGKVVRTEKAAGPSLRSTFAAAGLSLEPVPVKLVYYAREDGSVRLAWDLVLHTPDQRHVYNLFVDAETGTEVARHDWLSWDSYEVFAQPKESPLDGPRTVEVDPADPTASPFGWHDTNGAAGAEFTVTRGNNVCAQTDRNANNSACGTETQPDGGASLDFTGAVVPLNLALSPIDYQEAAVANLFYMNNVMHDVLYAYGFDEASGNFQENNYGNGGSGSDSVDADAQDGSGTNNANFATPPDGSNPRMQMYEWTPVADSLVTVNSPGSIAGDYTATRADFGATLTTTGITGDLELVDDGSASGSEGCGSLVGFTAGRIAVIDRGTCEFGTKVLNAEDAGAIAAIVVNNQGDGTIVMGPGADGAQVTIAAVMIGQGDGDTIKAQLGGGVNGTVKDAGGAVPNRDSDIDNGIIAHEYCHGLSIRLTGGAQTSNCLSGNQQAGEGWSDLCALFLTAKVGDQGTDARGIGNYAIFEPADGPGIRPFPYSTDLGVNPLTYGELAAGTLSIPHGIGTVWASIVWEVYWNLVDKYGFDADLIHGNAGNNVAFQLVVDGLKLQPCNPTFVNARDAILLADQQNNGGANECEIWRGFAKRGVGVNAQDGGSSNSLNVTEDFTVPAQCAEQNVCGNGVCESANAEDCMTCPQDCIGGTSSGAVCGNGVCEAGNGEDCVSCAADCNGVQGGKPSNRFCCGDGDGSSPVSCADSRCTSGGFSCTDVPVPGGSFCCGDAVCEGDETCSTCGTDCNLGVELCSGGIDEDCDGDVDCADSDCASAPECQTTCADVGESCSNDGDCCSLHCSGGKPSTRVCLAP
jgi:extracellular elastinolytic metalloproteinase